MSGDIAVDEGSADWQVTLERIVPAIVVLRIVSTRPFDTENAGSSYATGFVVDKARGIILTNRHVVKPGPITADAVFFNREEIQVIPVYRDPIHDFGFLRFDPTKVQFTTPTEVPLDAEAAAVGLEVRVVGNDSGEKLSILSGTIARLDRDAPVYSKSGYNDFNTFYLQAASGTKGGSSGSPVINIHGKAVGLNAGSKTKSQSAFFLPLHRVVRALREMQKFLEPVPPTGLQQPPIEPFTISRGTIRTTLSYKGFDEARRLGLGREIEACVREASGPSETGMLVVENVVPEGEADEILLPGDVVVRLNGVVTTSFLRLEEMLDDNVGGSVTMDVVRGGEEKKVSMQVGDLHAISPKTFVHVAGGVVQQLSYQQARNFLAPCGIVYVADPGYMLGRACVPRHAIITSLNGVSTPTLDDFCRVISSLVHGTRVPLEFYVFSERHRTQSVVLHMDTKWYGEPIYWTRDDSLGLWKPVPCREKWPSPAPKIEECTEAGTGATDGEMAFNVPGPERSHEAKEKVGEKIMKVIMPSLVLVSAEVPPVALADGVHSKSFEGSGVVVYHSKENDFGLVLVDRNTVPISSCDIMISFGAYPCEVAAKVVFLHPVHNFAIVSYRAEDLVERARNVVKSSRLRLTPTLSRGDHVHLIGLSSALQPSHRVSTVTNAAATVSISPAEVPRFRAVNEEIIELDNDFGHTFSGVLADDNATIVALWASFAKQVKGQEREFVRGLSSSVIAYWIDKAVVALNSIKNAATISPQKNLFSMLSVGVLQAELEPMLLAKAATFNLPENWVHKLSHVDTARRQILRIKGCVAGSHAAHVLKTGDMLLAVDGIPVTNFQMVEQIIADRPWGIKERQEKRQRVEKENDSDADTSPLKLTLFRKNKEIEVDLKLALELGCGTSRLVHWAGAMLQEPHRAVRELGYLPDSAHGVYVSRWHHGSPAHRYGLFALHWIVEVNGTRTPTLDAFLDVVRNLKHGQYVVVKLMHLNMIPKVLTLRIDDWYWPLHELTLDPIACEWTRHS